MFTKIRISSFFIFFTLLLAYVAAEGQDARRGPTVPWKLTVVVLDGADQAETAEIPAAVAAEFIEAHSRFKLNIDYVSAPVVHEFTPYKTTDADGIETTRYAMMAWNVPDSLIESLPVSTSYIFLYKLFGNLPAQAGSALGVDFGIKKGGVARPYATIPTDQWWYVNRPTHGFKNSAAQVLTHEIINTIQAKIEAAPYNCGQMKAKPGTPADKYESDRLASIPDSCYEKLSAAE